MAHKCFISFKTEDMDYKKKIQEDMDIDMIDKSLDEPINSDDEDYIMRKIREDYLADSIISIFFVSAIVFLYVSISHSIVVFAKNSASYFW